MRRTLAVTAVLGLSALSLVGCATTTDASGCARETASDSSTFDLVTVEGDAGSMPDVELRVPFYVDNTSFTDLSDGAGTAVHADDQLVVLDVTLVSGANGEVVASTAYDGAFANALTVAQWQETLPGIEGALTCAAPGTRVVVAIPPGGLAEATLAGFGMTEEDSAVAVIDVQKVYLTAADGADQYNDARGLPTVVRAPDGRPGVIIPDAPAPTKATTQLLKKGEGPKISGTESVRLHFTLLGWDDRTVQQSTWDTEPASATMEQLGGEVGDALIGQTVGSQLLIVVPADESATDPQAQVFVIDILGIDGTPAG